MIIKKKLIKKNGRGLKGKKKERKDELLDYATKLL